MSDTHSNSLSEQNLPLIQRIVSVLWPSFVIGSFTTILFFVVFDPLELAMLAGWTELTALGGYTIGFFFFWIMTSLGCALTCFFRKPCPPRVRSQDQK